jgi:hypothetical protein
MCHSNLSKSCLLPFNWKIKYRITVGCISNCRGKFWSLTEGHAALGCCKRSLEIISTPSSSPVKSFRKLDEFLVMLTRFTQRVRYAFSRDFFHLTHILILLATLIFADSGDSVSKGRGYKVRNQNLPPRPAVEPVHPCLQSYCIQVPLASFFARKFQTSGDYFEAALSFCKISFIKTNK